MECVRSCATFAALNRQERNMTDDHKTDEPTEDDDPRTNALIAFIEADVTCLLEAIENLALSTASLLSFAGGTAGLPTDLIQAFLDVVQDAAAVNMRRFARNALGAMIVAKAPPCFEPVDDLKPVGYRTISPEFVKAMADFMTAAATGSDDEGAGARLADLFGSVGEHVN